LRVILTGEWEEEHMSSPTTHDRWPEAEESTEDRLFYDPNSSESIAAARERLRVRLGLPYQPTLCSDPGRGRRLREHIARLFGRSRN
jgi:hypothetical protein